MENKKRESKFEKSKTKVISKILRGNFKSGEGDNLFPTPTKLEAINILCYYYKLQGYSSRKLANLGEDGPSHTTISKWIREGKELFEGSFMYMFLCFQSLLEKEGIDVSFTYKPKEKRPPSVKSKL